MPGTLRLFISYAREDEKIADAVRAALSKALPTPLAFVDMDKYTIEVGADFAADIQDKLDKAHVLVIVYTGRELSSEENQEKLPWLKENRSSYKT